jgi:hypothetical protein
MSPLVIVAASVSRAMPKSTTRGPSGPSSTLAGLKSRCTTPAPWIAVSAVAVPPRGAAGHPLTAAPVVHPLLQRRAVDELADDVAPVAFRRRLDDARRDERLDLVNGVEFAGQPLEHVGVHGGSQDLDRDPLFARVRPRPR